MIIVQVKRQIKKEGPVLDLKRLVWDYSHPLDDDMWKARRLAEFFPFILDKLTREDKDLLIKELDKINLPEERKEFIRMVCGEK
jgi:hypothetical protein